MDDSRTVDGMTLEEVTEVQRIHDVVLKAMDRELWQVARLLVTRRDDELLGQTEFELRDRVLRMGAQALEATVNDRKKRGTKAAALPVQTAARMRGSLDGGRGPS